MITKKKLSQFSKRKLEEFVAEERQASKIYKKYGFNKIAKQEHQHFVFFDKLINKKRKKYI